MKRGPIGLGLAAALALALFLAGCGGKGNLNANPSELDFGNLPLSTQSGIQRVTIKNEDRGDIKIQSLMIAGTNPQAFSITDATTCAGGAELGKRDSCVVAVRFRANGLGQRSAILEVANDGDNSPTEVKLVGTGVGASSVTLGTTRMDFSSVDLGQSRTQQTTVTNTGNAALTFTSIAIQGTNASDFALASASTTCSKSTPVKVGASCTIAVAFSPKAVGQRSASLVLQHNAKGSPSTIELTGQGVGKAQIGLSPTTLDFGTVALGSKSKSKTVTVKNSGTASLTVIGLSIGGTDVADFRVSGGTCSEGGKVGAGKSCTVTVVFAPTASGVRTANLAVATSANSQPSRVNLQGTGASPSPPPTTTTG